MTSMRTSCVLLAMLTAVFVDTSLVQSAAQPTALANTAGLDRHRSVVVADQLAKPEGQEGVRRRAEDLANAASRRFSDILAEKQGDQGTSVKTASEAPTREPALEWQSFIQRVQDWLARSRRAYRTQIVKKLRRPLEAETPETAVAKAGGEPETQAGVKSGDASKDGASPGAVVAVPEGQPQGQVVEAAPKTDEDAEAKRVADAAEAKRKADEEAEAKRLADAADANRKAEEEAEAKRVADAAEAKRKADEDAEAKRVADAAEAKRKADEEAEAKRLADAADANRKAEEVAEAKRVADAAEAKRKADEEAEAKRLADAADADRKAADEAKAQRVAEAPPVAEVEPPRDDMAEAAEPVPEAPEKAPERMAPVDERVPSGGSEKRVSTPSRPKAEKTKVRVRKATVRKGTVRKKRVHKRRYRKHAKRARSARRVATRTGYRKHTRVFGYRKTRRSRGWGGGRMYVVRRGDTLSGIAKRHYGNGAGYRKIYRANRAKIRNPNRIYPRQRLYIPARRRR